MADSKPPTDRLQVTVGLKTHAYLNVLGSKGTHGVGPTDVAKSLIEQGVRQAILDGFISKDDVAKVENVPTVHTTTQEK